MNLLIFLVGGDEDRRLPLGFNAGVSVTSSELKESHASLK